MNRQQFLEEIASIVMIRKGRLTADSLLDEINWDSMAALEFQSMVSEKLKIQLEPTDISECSKVLDLCKLAKIEE
jgi:acyl carrier protein